MLKLIWLNWVRNWGRNLGVLWPLTVATILLIVVWSLVNGLTNEIFENTVGFAGGHIRITNERGWLNDYSMADKVAHANFNVIWTAPQIKIKSIAISQTGQRSVLSVGIDPVKAELLLALNKKIIAGRLIKSAGAEVLIGKKLAQALKINIGETLRLGTRDSQGKITALDQMVVGIFETKLAAIDRGVVYLPLDQAQALVGLNQGVTELLVIVNNASDAPRIASEIKKKLTADQFKVTAWQDQGVMFFIINSLRAAGTIFIILAFLIAILQVVNFNNYQTVLRATELTNLIYLGITKREIVKMLFGEAIFSGLAAGIMGGVCANLILAILNIIGLDITANSLTLAAIVPSLHRATLYWPSLFYGVVVVSVAALLAIIPATKSLNSDSDLFKQKY
jgi:putative ABC transport system permease protein